MALQFEQVELEAKRQAEVKVGEWQTVRGTKSEEPRAGGLGNRGLKGCGFLGRALTASSMRIPSSTEKVYNPGIWPVWICRIAVA